MNKVFVVFVVTLLSGCAAQQPAPVETSQPAAPPVVIAKTESTAIAGLIESARSDASAGRLARAGATLEGALRNEPCNPRLWHELAKVRLRQADFSQAESLA